MGDPFFFRKRKEPSSSAAADQPIAVYPPRNLCSQGQAAASAGGCTLGIAAVGSGLRKVSFTLG